MIIVLYYCLVLFIRGFMKITKITQKEVYEKALQGKTVKAIAKEYGVSKQRISQIIKLQNPDITRAEFGASKRKTNRIAKRQEEIKTLYNRDSYGELSDLERAMGSFFTRKRQNSKHRHDWNISMSDLEWPLICPVLGIPLDWFAESRQENSPSIDRLDSSKGYIKGNVAIMSWRANRIKNDGTAKEHQQIADFLDKIKT